MMLPLEEYYFLLHAFDRLGRRLYPSEWTGDEFEQSPMNSPEVIAARREPIEKGLSEIGLEIDAARAAIARTTDEAEIAAHKERLPQLFEERSDLQIVCADVDSTTTITASLRPIKGELRPRQCCSARSKPENIHAQYGRGLMIDWAAWSRERGFKCYLALSLVAAPRLRSGMRRATVLIRRDEFEKWLQLTWPDDPAARAAMSMEQRCEEWLADFVRKSDGKKPLGKPSIYADAKRDIPGLPRRVFDRVWSGRVVPPLWRKKGAPGRRQLPH